MSTKQASGFAQIPPEGGIVRDDAVRKFELGTVISDTLGNSYRYVKAGVALTEGMVVETAANAAWDTTIVVDGAVTAGDAYIHVDTLASAMTENQYRGYWISQAAAAGLGRGMKIAHHKAQTADGDELDIYLEDVAPEDIGDGVALLINHPYVVQPIGTGLAASAGTEIARGVAIGAITIAQYGFVQIGGHCPAVAVGGTTSAAIVIDEPLIAPTTVTTDMAAGSMQGFAGSTETDILECTRSPIIALQAVGANTAGFIQAFIKGMV